MPIGFVNCYHFKTLQHLACVTATHRSDTREEMLTTNTSGTSSVFMYRYAPSVVSQSATAASTE